MVRRIPQPNDIYVHYKGEKFIVVVVAKSERDGIDSVVYKSLDDGTVWHRPIDEFLEILCADEGTCCYRFHLMACSCH